MKHVTASEFIDRIIRLATKYSEYACQFMVYHYKRTEIEELLQNANIKYKLYNGSKTYDKYGVVWGFMLILNCTGSETLHFDKWVSKYHQPFENELQITANEILEYLIEYSKTSPSFKRSNKSLEILIKDLISTVFINYKPITILIEQPSKKRQYEEIKTENEDEIVIKEITIVEKCTKKVKI